MAVSGVLVSAYAVLDLSSRVNTAALPSKTSEFELVNDTLDGAVNVLVVGSDSREGQQIDDGELGELNDVTMMLHVSEDHKSATVVSFPRDLMLPIPSCPGPNGEEFYYSAMSEQQLNSTLGYGLPCVVRTIEELTGASIPYAGLITFDGVINMSKAVGGVEVCLTQPIYDPKTDLDLPAGDVTLVGTEALQFLRTRHGVGDGGDQSRISNQQVFLSALMRKVKSGGTLSDPVKVYGLGKAAVENMTLSENMASVGFMKAVAGILRDIDLDNITFVQYPTFSHPYQEGRLIADPYAGELLMEKILEDQPLEIARAGVAVAEDEPSETDEDAVTDDLAGDGSTEAEFETSAEEGDDLADEDAPLPANVTGQKASKVTCSAGRVQY